MVGGFILDMWFQLRRYGRWSEVLQHLLTAEREVMLASSVLVRTLREAAAPYAKDDPFASLMHDALKFADGVLAKLTPAPMTQSSHEFDRVREAQRRAMLAIRDVLLEERAAVTPNQELSAFRSEVIDSILRVLDGELARIDLSDEDLEHDDFDNEETDDEDTVAEDAVAADTVDENAVDEVEASAQPRLIEGTSSAA